MFASAILLAAIGLPLPSSLAASVQERAEDVPNYPYTLTAYAPGNSVVNGGKFQDGGRLLQAHVTNICPISQTWACPNGTETVFVGTLGASAMVPGGQNLYVNTDGQILFTIQHSHSIPAGAYWNYVGWTWTALPTDELKDPLPGCDTTDERFNCTSPSGYWNFAAPDAAPGISGVVACPNVADPSKWNAYAVTPKFTRTDCVSLVGLGTHQYTGENPPVWNYYN